LFSGCTYVAFQQACHDVFLQNHYEYTAICLSTMIRIEISIIAFSIFSLAMGSDVPDDVDAPQAKGKGGKPQVKGKGGKTQVKGGKPTPLCIYPSIRHLRLQHVKGQGRKGRCVTWGKAPPAVPAGASSRPAVLKDYAKGDDGYYEGYNEGYDDGWDHGFDEGWVCAVYAMYQRGGGQLNMETLRTELSAAQ
jgi:hypothetical protein